MILEPKSTHKSWLYIVAIIMVMLLTVGIIVVLQNRQQQNEVGEPTNTTQPTEIADALPGWLTGNDKPTTPTVDTPNQTSTSSTLAKSVKLAVPFTPQAPTANWDELHNEACEEASAIMAAAFFAGDKHTTLPASEVEEQIKTITEYFKNKYGYYLDTTQAETAEMIETHYGLTTKLIDDFTVEDIKKALSEGKLVIMNFDGRLLGNPNFRGDGPPYHMIVVTGYDGNKFITNDPGTRKGRGYVYSADVLMNAAGDWNHTTHGADTSVKRIMIVSK